MPKNNPRLLYSKDWTGKLHKTGQNVHKTTHTSQARESQIQIICVCSWRHFYAYTDRRTVCATVHHSFISAVQFYIYVTLSSKTSFDGQQKEIVVKMQAAAADPRLLVIDLFHNQLFRILFAGALCVCACI